MNLKEAPRNTKQYLRRHIASTVFSGSTLFFTGLGFSELKESNSLPRPSTEEIQYADQHAGLNNALYSIDLLPEKNENTAQAQKLLYEELEVMDLNKVYEIRKKTVAPGYADLNAMYAFGAAAIGLAVACAAVEKEDRNKKRLT